MKIIDPGHKYELLCLDGKKRQLLQFVKRFDREDPRRYPGNTNAYPGTTVQSVILCLLNRMRYLQTQIACVENEMIISNLQQCLFLLESRAARRHRLKFNPSSLEELEFTPLCKECGHTICHHASFQ